VYKLPEGVGSNRYQEKHIEKVTPQNHPANLKHRQNREINAAELITTKKKHRNSTSLSRELKSQFEHMRKLQTEHFRNHWRGH